MRELLMIHALDERDLLRSRIMGKIGKITFLDYKKQCEGENCRNTYGGEGVLR